MAVCATCQKPLVLEIEASDDEDVSMGGSSSATAPQTVPDDVHLSCNCHFHWDCLLSSYTIDSCPSCSSPLVTTSSTGTQRILCTLSNEGGVQEHLDIMPLLIEESYLKAYPEERKPRAFLEFCRAGDLPAIIEMVQADDDEDEDEEEEDEAPQPKSAEFLRYQDPNAEMQSGLHAAVQAGSREVAWFLLLMASNLELQEFPAQVFQEAETIGLMRPEEGIEGRVDIRSLRDANGRSAEDVAREAGAVWRDWIGKGWLTV